MMGTTFVKLCRGTDWTRKCTGFLSVPSSRNFNWYRCSISRQTSCNTLSTAESTIARRYLAGKTRWDNKTVTLWLLWMYSLTRVVYAASGGEYTRKWFKLTEYYWRPHSLSPSLYDESHSSEQLFPNLNKESKKIWLIQRILPFLAH